MENKTRKTAGLVALMALTTGFATAGIFAATTQSVITGGDISYTAFPHVGAKVVVDIDGTVIDTVEFATTEHKTEKSIASFSDKLAAALNASNSDDNTKDGGEVEVDKSAVVKFTVTNTGSTISEGWAFDCSIDFTAESLVNMKAETVGKETKELAVGDEQAYSYTISIVDELKDASGTFNWSVVFEGK